MQDWKMTDQRKSMGWKMQDWKMQDYTQTKININIDVVDRNCDL